VPETWWLPSPDGEGTLVMGAHDAGDCSGACALHRPSRHWARDMPLRWEWGPAGGSMLRLCPHGLLHHDPDDMEYRRSREMPQPKGAHDSGGSCPCDRHCGCNEDWPLPF